MAGVTSIAFDVAELSLLVGLAIGAVSDWRVREVTDRLWQALAISGGLLGIVAFGSGSTAALELWLLVAALAIGQLLPWDDALARWSERLVGAIEVIAFIGVGIAIAFGIATIGLGGSGVPIAILGAYLGTVLARGLFELRLLYGGADAKALIAVSVLVPVDASSWATLPGNAGAILGLYPFALTVLMNAATLSLVVPVAIALRNLRRGEFHGLAGFSTYSIPLEKLPEGFVWLREPVLPGMEDDAEAVATTAEDRALRVRERAQLLAQGVRSVRVSPQIPFLVAIFLGAVSALALGNLVFDLLALA